MGNKESTEKLDKQRFLAFKEKYTDMGEYQDPRYGKHRLYEENSAGPRSTKEKVVAKTVEPTREDDFSKIMQMIKRREEIRSPHLCKVYGVYDASEALLCGTFHRLTYLYEHCTYDLEMDLTNRSRLPNTHSDKVGSFY